MILNSPTTAAPTAPHAIIRESPLLAPFFAPLDDVAEVPLLVVVPLFVLPVVLPVADVDSTVCDPLELVVPVA